MPTCFNTIDYVGVLYLERRCGLFGVRSTSEPGDHEVSLWNTWHDVVIPDGTL